MKRMVGLILIGLILGTVETGLGLMALPENMLGWFLIFTGVGYCLGGGIYLAFGRVSGQPTAVSDRSLLALAPGAVAVLLLPGVEYVFLPAVLPRAPAWQWLGLALIAAGMGLRIWVRLALKGTYSGNMAARAGQSLVTSGPYRYLRHPGYASFIVMAVGIGLGFSSLGGLLAAVLLLLPGMAYRIRVEERMLVEQYGQEYRRYAQRTWRLLPLVW